MTISETLVAAEKLEALPRQQTAQPALRTMISSAQRQLEALCP
jgi:hypothetical protein